MSAALVIFALLAQAPAEAPVTPLRLSVGTAVGGALLDVTAAQVQFVRLDPRGGLGSYVRLGKALSPTLALDGELSLTSVILLNHVRLSGWVVWTPADWVALGVGPSVSFSALIMLGLQTAHGGVGGAARVDFNVVKAQGLRRKGLVISVTGDAGLAIDLAGTRPPTFSVGAQLLFGFTTF